MDWIFRAESNLIKKVMKIEHEESIILELYENSELCKSMHGSHRCKFSNDCKMHGQPQPQMCKYSIA